MSSKQVNILNDLENLVSHLGIQMAILIWLFAGANDNFNCNSADSPHCSIPCLKK